MARASPHVRFLGHQSGENLEVLYRDAVALIYPSANFQVGISRASVSGGQGAPLVIMEAFAQRTPVVARSVGTISNLLEHTGAGLLYSTDEELIAAMNRLLADPAYREALGARGYAAYEKNWTVDAYLDRYFELIDQLGTERASK
jgi:glycosyltransferase involved in cell wall biosynthesis